MFSIVFSQALFAQPDKKNEVSGLMIMGLFGGTVFPLLMGFASDAIGQDGAVAVMTIGVIYLFFIPLKSKSNHSILSNTSFTTGDIMNHIVVGMGEALWDVLPEGRENRRSTC